MDDTTIDVRSILGLLRRQLRLIALVVVLCVAAAALVVYLLTPIYAATALVLFDPSTKNLLDPDAPLTATGADNARIDSEVEIIRSDSILLQVVDAADLVHDAQFNSTGGLRQMLSRLLGLAPPELDTPEAARNRALAKLLTVINVQRRGLTYLIAIEARSADPNDAARIANIAAKVYIDDQLAAKVTSIMSARQIVQARVNQGRAAIIASEGSFDGFIAANIEKISRDSGRSDFMGTQAQIAQLTQARTDIATAIDHVQNNLAADDWPTLAETLQSEALAQLDQQRRTLSSELATTNTPLAEQVRAQLADIQTDMRSTADGDISALRLKLTETQANEQNLRQNLRQQILSSALSADTLTQLYELQQNAELARAQYQSLLVRAQDMDTQASLQMADSRIVSPALPPHSPSWPNPPLALLLAAIGGLGLGILLAFIYDNLIGGFTTEEQAEAGLKTRVATAIARTRIQATGIGLADLVVNAPLSAFAESVRRIRATIDYQVRLVTPENSSRTGRVIMVSSTAPNEGKTTVGLALARSYALAGRSTLLIDCDLRHPSVHRLLDIEPSRGLNEFLGDTTHQRISLDSIISTDALSNATVIVGAHISQYPTDQLLTAAAFTKLIDAARASHDVVILDSPPIGPVIDGLYIAPFADVIVFVVKWASTAQRDARKTLASLNAVKRPGSTILAVLNQQDESRRADRRKYGDNYRAA